MTHHWPLKTPLWRALFVVAAVAMPCVAHAQSGDEALVRRNVQKLLSQPDVKQTITNLEQNMHVLHQKADELTEGTITATQRQWKQNVDKLINDYQKSDVPRKLREGDWSLVNEAYQLMKGPDEQAPAQHTHTTDTSTGQ